MKKSAEYYKNLLRKYIQHVVDCEGTDFIWLGSHHSGVGFSDQETEDLETLSLTNINKTKQN